MSMTSEIVYRHLLSQNEDMHIKKHTGEMMRDFLSLEKAGENDVCAVKNLRIRLFIVASIFTSPR